jgi:hypothetical protein
VTDHYHYEYAGERHDHRGDYAEPGHNHEAYEVHGAATRQDISRLESFIAGLREDLSAAESRIRELEQQTPQARQLQLEADLAAADLAESGYDRHDGQCSYCATDEPEPGESDPGPEVDDESGMSEDRHAWPGEDL